MQPHFLGYVAKIRKLVILDAQIVNDSQLSIRFAYKLTFTSIKSFTFSVFTIYDPYFNFEMPSTLWNKMLSYRRETALQRAL